MRELTDRELFDLSTVVEDSVLYLTLRTEDEVLRVFKMLYPTYPQKQLAALEKHKRHSELGKLRLSDGLKTRRELERDYKEELVEIRKEQRECRREVKRLERALIEKHFVEGEPLPDPEVDPDAFNLAVEKISTDLEDLSERMGILASDIEGIFQYSIEALSQNEEIARLAQMCWFRAVDSEGETGEEKVVEEEGDKEKIDEEKIDEEKWEAIWPAWEDYCNDARPLTQLLFNETHYWVKGGIPPFVG